MTADDNFDLSDAVALYLQRYPGKNDEAFNSFYGPASAHAHEQVRLILKEAMQVGRPIGFDLDEVDADVVYGDRPAWAVVLHL